MEQKPQNGSGFDYSYSARQQEEIKAIRKKYLPQEEGKLERLRRLDRSVTRKGTVVAMIVGVIGCLILGFGMSCVTVWADTLFLAGILIGAVGIACILLAYPLYQLITRRQRKKIAPEILRLTDELTKESGR